MQHEVYVNEDDTDEQVLYNALASIFSCLMDNAGSLPESLWFFKASQATIAAGKDMAGQ
jgi:hypothetical protein